MPHLRPSAGVTWIGKEGGWQSPKPAMGTNLHAVGAGLINPFGLRASEAVERTRLQSSVVAAAQKVYS